MIQSSQLEQICLDLCCTMLGFQVDFEADSPARDFGNVSQISILGERNFELRVSAPYLTASVIAARIFHLMPVEVDDDALQDAMNELTNIIGGNIKGMLDGEYRLSLPQRIAGSPDSVPSESSVVLACNATTCPCPSPSGNRRVVPSRPPRCDGSRQSPRPCCAGFA